MKPRGFHELKHVLHQRAAYCYALCKLTSQFTLAKPTRLAGDRKDRSLRTRRDRNASSHDLRLRPCRIHPEWNGADLFPVSGSMPREINWSLNKSRVRARAYVNGVYADRDIRQLCQHVSAANRIFNAIGLINSRLVCSIIYAILVIY